MKKFKSFRSYCSYIFTDSLVTGLTPIIKTKGYVKKTIKILFLAFSLCGFLYQTWEFLSLYFEYTTVESPTSSSIMTRPAVTICDRNFLRRTYLCEARPEACDFSYADRKYSFCFDYPTYCEDLNNTLYALVSFPKIPEVVFDMNFTKEAGFQLNESLVSCKWHYGDSSENPKNQNNACSEARFVRGLTEAKFPLPCYSFNLHVGEKNYTEEYFESDATLMISLRWLPNDSLNPKIVRSYLLSFHHPTEMIDPFEKGALLTQNRLYKVDVHQETTVRLPPPYTTKCHDYTKDWIKNGGKGPINREQCQVACGMKEQLKMYGCVLREVTISHEEKICRKRPPLDREFNRKVRICMKECTEACKQTKYIANVKVLHQQTFKDSVDMFGTSTGITLEIHFYNLESIIIYHKPKYESVELFSYIGGYLGMWLGWSLVAIFDFLETLIKLLQYPLMKKRENKKVDVRPFNMNNNSYHYY